MTASYSRDGHAISLTSSFYGVRHQIAQNENQGVAKMIGEGRGWNNDGVSEGFDLKGRAFLSTVHVEIISIPCDYSPKYYYICTIILRNKCQGTDRLPAPSSFLQRGSGQTAAGAPPEGRVKKKTGLLLSRLEPGRHTLCHAKEGYQHISARLGDAVEDLH